MMLIHNTVYVSRALQAAAHNAFDAPNERQCLSRVFQAAISIRERATQFTKSLLGKIAVCIGAEIVGAQIGELAGRVIAGEVASEIGERIFPYIALNALVVGGATSTYFLAKKTSDTALICFVLISPVPAVLAMNLSSEQLSNVGASSGRAFGEQIGAIAGTILGGFGGLLLAGSPTVLWNAEDSHNSYSVSMIRFLAMGIAFDACITTPTTPIITPLLLIPRQGIRAVAQTLAYNSAIFLPCAMQCIKGHRVPGKILTPFFLQIIVNKLNGSSGSNKNQEYTAKKLYIKIFSPFVILSRIIRKGIKIGIEQSAVPRIETAANLFVNITLKSFHYYVQLLQNSESVRVAQTEFKNSFHNPDQRERSRIILVEAIDTLLKSNWPYSENIAQSIVESLLKDRGVKLLISELIDKIQVLEVELVGFSLLSENKATYLKEIVDIHLQHYLVYLLLNYAQLSEELTPAEEEEIILDLNNFIIGGYAEHAIPPFMADAARQMINKGLQFIFNAKKLIQRVAQKSEQRTHLSVQDESQIVEEYFPPLSSLDLFQDYAIIPEEEEGPAFFGGEARINGNYF
jgi:hypothetical protein